ncbi:hypothetical protein AB1Y20_023408 [Prymnesium parvum]|uniref:Peptide N-acetyl-beta-D-glucosaminyl asparaginase amidase A N-terminal domain-containing protein n=1 Tax=Prymnesium parvum TaxID=97485 RepID=A0AB34JE78_PRYPA
MAGHLPGPLQAGPPLVSEGAIPPAACHVALHRNVSLSGFDVRHVVPYQPPHSCPPPYRSVILRVDGSVRGRQFDREGALWIGAVEVLRTTTPEPTPRGIRWSIERELVDYSPLFLRAANATLQVDNLVDQTYTGVIYMDVGLTFYPAPPNASHPAAPDTVLALGGASPSWGGMRVAGRHARGGTLHFPRRNVYAGRVDVYASAHGDEEFWYSNVPDGFEAQTGALGGGAYRELQLLVDGQMAGVAHSFPVVYTGGFQPLLWRALTGPYSFNIPPVSFDLAPFLGLLNDGAPHEVSVLVEGNSAAGGWYVSGVFVGHTADELAPLTGEVTSIQSTPVSHETSGCNCGRESGAHPNASAKCAAYDCHFDRHASATFAASGTLRSVHGGSTVLSSISSQLRARLSNVYREGRVRSAGHFNRTSRLTRSMQLHADELTLLDTTGTFHFPFEMDLTEASDRASNTSTEHTSVRLAAIRAEAPLGSSAPPHADALAHRIASLALPALPLAWERRQHSLVEYNVSHEGGINSFLARATADFTSTDSCALQHINTTLDVVQHGNHSDFEPRASRSGDLACLGELAHHLLCRRFDECAALALASTPQSSDSTDTTDLAAWALQPQAIFDSQPMGDVHSVGSTVSRRQGNLVGDRGQMPELGDRRLPLRKWLRQ